MQEEDWPELRQGLDEWEFSVWELDGSQIRDRHTFFRQVLADFDLPGVTDIRSWHGLQDYLWGRLAQGEETRLVIVWRQADRMLDGGLGVLLEAVDVLRELARSVGGGEESGFPREVELSIVLTGQGPNFH